jgi:DNA repair exonuclease SbcCD nuclease subunit
MSNILKKGAMFTDIHFGKHNNSEEHNKDCIDFISWFCEEVQNDNSIDHIWFLGDWHEHRSAINAFTLQQSFYAAKMLNELNIPVFFIVGNHDMASRNTRTTFTTEIFEPLSNFILLDDIQVIKNIHGKVLAVPFLKEEEYPNLINYNSPVVMGHLELKGFRVSGSSNVMEHGPDASNIFKNKKRVFSGHFHARQSKDNVHYIGNTFPMDFSDANDSKRGMAIYDFVNDDLVYKDWQPHHQ